MNLHKTGLVLMLGAVVAAGCGGREEAAPQAAPAPAPPPVESAAPEMMSASASLQPRQGSTVSGSVSFEQAAAGGPVTITASVAGAPAGSRGFHIHELGDCSAADFTSAGGHFNPAGDPHGSPTDAARHAGDLGNIEIGADGSGSLELASDLITLAAGQPNSVVGRAVILHEGTDDLVSQPTGDAGGRIACGVIG